MSGGIISNHPWPAGPLPPAWAAEPVRTARMVLRPLAEADRAVFIRAQTASREHMAPWNPLPQDVGLEAPPDRVFEITLRRTLEVNATGAAARLVGFAEGGSIAGFFNLNNIVRGVAQSADAGWSVTAEFAGRGYATEGVRALLALAFAPPPLGLGLHRVQAGIMPRNTRSIRVAEKCGMRREGLALRLIKIAGAWEDHWLYARTVEEHGPGPSS